MVRRVAWEIVDGRIATMMTPDLNTEAGRLRAKPSRSLRVRGNGRVSIEERRRAIEFPRRPRNPGERWHAISTALGIATKKLPRWCAAVRCEDVMGGFHAVEVVAEQPVGIAAVNGGGPLQVVLPNGVGLEGLHVADATAVLRALAGSARPEASGVGVRRAVGPAQRLRRPAYAGQRAAWP